MGYETVSEMKPLVQVEEVEKDITLNFSAYTKTTDTDTIDAAVSTFSAKWHLEKGRNTIDGDAIEAAW